MHFLANLFQQCLSIINQQNSIVGVICSQTVQFKEMNVKQRLTLKRGKLSDAYMRNVRNADSLPHELTGRRRISVSVGDQVRVQARVQVRLKKFGFGVNQLLDGDALPQPVQGQNRLDGRNAASVLLDERLPIHSLVVLI